MARVKKAKRRSPHVVMYVRVKPEEHAQIAKIAEGRGYPHTLASVVADIITHALRTEVWQVRAHP